MRWENKERNLRRLYDYLRDNQDEKVALFDIGTRAVRVLVAPKKVPDYWDGRTFFNDGQVFELGADVGKFDQKLRIKQSRALRDIIAFISTYLDILHRSGILIEDVSAFGTAVFRWLENREEVIDYIKNETGIAVYVIPEAQEAQFSLFAIGHTFKSTQNETHNVTIGENDALLLIDQGGGSTEISYLYPNKFKGNVHSIDSLGTTALREEFFRLGPDGWVDPNKNLRRISTQNERIIKLIQKRIDSWKGYPELKQSRIFAYAMGTAIQKCARGSTYNAHNQLFSVDDLMSRLKISCSELEQSTQQVRTLYGLIQDESSIGGKRLNDLLVRLYGLPVYFFILKKFGITEVRYAAYGLRYGAYVAKYKFGVPF
ncbi:MAG: hypothetical protein C4575_10580 [Desulforudis sp.]|nr:MAG: hypothetical protein C4575_10580 [Desulforudis sp.]